ncbi:hypothetical protein HDV00_010356 [Rhizophlyctis rosea]|nr:hypothetical protein HDV00_010356 [Rhizophlyctis rosea]
MPSGDRMERRRSDVEMYDSFEGREGWDKRRDSGTDLGRLADIKSERRFSASMSSDNDFRRPKSPRSLIVLPPPSALDLPPKMDAPHNATHRRGSIQLPLPLANMSLSERRHSLADPYSFPAQKRKDFDADIPTEFPSKRRGSITEPHLHMISGGGPSNGPLPPPPQLPHPNTMSSSAHPFPTSNSANNLSIIREEYPPHPSLRRSSYPIIPSRAQLNGPAPPHHPHALSPPPPPSQQQPPQQQMQFVQTIFTPDGTAGGLTPYSRSPELRVSHKLAERKRRKEMKELFEELKDAMPEETFKNTKASKWEILSKAIEYIGTLSEAARDREALAQERDALLQQVNPLSRAAG